MNILILYNATQTYTSTVFEHLVSFAQKSKHRYFFCHVDQYSEFNESLCHFDAVGLHYSVRLPYDQVSQSVADTLRGYGGLKFLFIQDEYDYTHRAWYWIKSLGLNLVFTVVPEAGIERVYPAREFPGVRFVSNLTGYVPENISSIANSVQPSKRSIIIGYRGRNLPVRYGKLGFEKVAIGEKTKQYCDAYSIKTDIAWTEEKRIYGNKWYEFLASCRSMLGSESGSNVFDWDGTLNNQLAEYKQKNPFANDHDLYENLIRQYEIDGLMNQVSPRVFEAIIARTVLVLFEGSYSGVVEPGLHYIPMKKDGSNLPDVVSKLHDLAYVDEMAERAFQDIIASGRYSYNPFVEFVDNELERSCARLRNEISSSYVETNTLVSVAHGINPTMLTTFPIRATPPQLVTSTSIALFRRGAIFYYLPPLVHRVIVFLKKIIPVSMYDFFWTGFTAIRNRLRS